MPEPEDELTVPDEDERPDEPVEVVVLELDVAELAAVEEEVAPGMVVALT